MKIKVVIFLMLVSGYVSAQPETASSDWDFERQYFLQDMGFMPPDKWNRSLYDNIEQWLGTPYCYAGNSKKGTDCSGFVSSVYGEVYRTSLGARNSADIYKKITKVDKDDLEEGDLVFFRFHRRRVTHMGLYLSNGKFVHASTSNGVIISDLKDPYYRKSYAGGGHLPHKELSEEISH